MTRPARTRPPRTRRPRVTTLPQLIANAVETNPDGVALVLADGTGPLEQVSYADLDAWSSRLARSLMARGIGPEDLVAVAIPRSLDAVLAVWAVAKTGAGFVPIDPAYPPGWVAHLLVDAGAVYGLAVSWVRNELPDEIEWLHVDTVETARSLERFSADPVTYADRIRPLRAEHPAYVCYAADGDAAPDGVVVTQAGLSGLCAEQQGRYRVDPEDRTLNFAPLPSDSSVLELLLALGGAATMVVVSPLVTTADEVTALLRRTGVTHAYLTPEALQAIDPAGLDELGVVVTGRRPCPPDLVRQWAIPLGDGRDRTLYQGYGPPETTVITTVSTPLSPGGPPTIGAPIRGVIAHILDEQLAQVPDGAVGELYLGGPQLARGYHRRPGRTAQLLIADPFADDGSRLYRTGDLVRRTAAGEMEYVGRIELPVEPASRTAAPGGPTGSPDGPDEAGAYPVERRDDPLPDYEQSLPIRESSAPEADAPAEAGPRFSEPEPEPAAPTDDVLTDDDETGSRLASEQRDMDLPGRGYLDMPDRRHPLPDRDDHLHEAGEPAPEPTVPPVAGWSPDPADAWLSSGHQLPAPGETRAGSGNTTPVPSDALAFYENPRDTAPDVAPSRDRSSPVAGAAAAPLPDWADLPRPTDGTVVANDPLLARGPAAPSPLWPEPAGNRVSEPEPEPEPVVADSEPPAAVERPASIPLSPGQLRLWERNRTGATGDMVTAAMRLTGTLDATAMQAAVADIVDRHETLRTVYPEAGGTPHQVVLPRELAVPEVLPEPVPAAELADWLRALAQTDFDTADPDQVPVRFALAELGPREHVVAVVAHRILADEVSAGLLLRDLLRAFLGRRNRSRPLWQPLSVQYLDYFLRRQAELGDITEPGSLAAARLAFWRDRLAELPPPLRIPADGPHPGTGQHGVHTFDIGTRTHRRIADIARRGGISEFLVVRAAFAVLLARSAAVTDIVLGSSVRGNDERELDDAIGPYANTVVLRTRIDPAESFLDLVYRVAESDREAFANADLPFEILTETVGTGGPLFDVAISLRHDDIPQLEMPSLSTEPVDVPEPATGIGLRLVIDPHRAPDGSPNGITAALHYAAGRFDAFTAGEFARRLQRVLTVAGGDPDSPVGDIDLLSRADLDRLLVVWNDTRYPVPPELVLDGYRRTVAARPDAPAVTDAGTGAELTYREFDSRVNRLARRLIAAGVGAETPVAVAVRDSADLVVAVFAVLTAGGAYLPLDPDDPVEWITQLLDIARPVCVLTTGADEPRLTPAVESAARGQRTPVLTVDTGDLGQLSSDPVRPEELLRPVRPGNAAYLMCASASATGPELVVVSHTALNNQITLMLAQHQLGLTDIYLQQNPATCDTSLWGYFLPLRAGARLVLAGTADPDRVAELIATYGVTVTDFGPAELAAFAERAGSVPQLREIFVTGAPLAPETVSAVRERCGAQVHHLYGNCETAVSATAWPAAGSAEPSVPIGLPQWNTRVYVLDSRLRPVPPGVPGELYIAGDQLARGYIGRPDVTADRFVANPYGYGQRMYRTGDLVLWRDSTATTPQRLDYLGRTDGQLRARGRRVQPRAIEAALRDLPEVAAAAVLPRTADAEIAAGSTVSRPGDELAAYVVPETPESPDVTRIRAALARLRPAHMVPSAFQVVEQIPVDGNGEPVPAELPDPALVPLLPSDAEPTAEETPPVEGRAEREAAEVSEEETPAGARAESPASAGSALTGAVEGDAGPAAVVSGEQEIAGEFPPTPTVVRVLDGPVPGIEVRSVVLDLPTGQPLSRIEAAVRAVAARHPMLWVRLETGESTPKLWLPPRERRGDHQYWWLGPDPGENAVAIDDVVQAAADALDPANGHNIHFVATGTEPDGKLVIVANGFVVDDRSWRILVDELAAEWGGAETAADPPDSRLAQLIGALDTRARSLELLDEAGWWRQNLAGARSGVAVGTADLRARRRVSLAITAEGTAAVTATADAYDATIPEVLLTAVAIALRTGEEGAVSGAIGSLVRCDADARVFVGGTYDLVGGFATEFPLSVRLTGIDTADALVGGPAAGAALVQIRDLYRSVPDGGAGYALLRYSNPETAAEFAAADSGRFTLRYRDLRPARVHTDGPADGVLLALTVDATDDGLLCRFDYATDVFVGEDVKVFAEHWVRALGGLAEHGLRPDLGYAPPAPRPPAEPEPLPDAEVTSLLRPVTGQPAPDAPPRQVSRAATAVPDAGPAPAPDAAAPGVRRNGDPAPGMPAPFEEAAPLPRRGTGPGTVDSAEEAGPGSAPAASSALPRRRPEADRGDESPAPGPLPRRRLGPDAAPGLDLTAPVPGAISPSGLPQRRPRPESEGNEAGEGAGPDRPSSGVLPQRCAHREPESGIGAVRPEPDAVSQSVLPQRRAHRESESGIGAVRPDPDAVSQSALPQRRPVAETGAGGEELGAGRRLPGALPQRRARLETGPGVEESGPDSGAAPPGALPRRRPQPEAERGDPVDHLGPPPLPQRCPRPEPAPAAPADSAPAVPADADPAVPADSGPIALPRRNPPTGLVAPAEPASAPLPQRSESAGPEDPKPLAGAPLPQRRPLSAAEPGTGSPATDTAPPPRSGLPQRRPSPTPEPPSAGRAEPPLPPAGGLTQDPEPTTFLRPVTAEETTAYLSPIRDLGLRDDTSTLLSLFDEQAARTPAVPAVRQGARMLGYAELDRKSKALAAELVRFGAGAGTLVAVAMRPGIDLVVAICAVLRAGGGYLPVDPARPAGEIDEVLTAAAPICVLSTSDEGVTTGTGISVVAIDLLYLDLPTDPAAAPVVAADDVADVRYPPGGGPGVTSTHRQLVERLRRAQRSHPYDSSDLVLHAAPSVGDIPLWELFRPLHSGAQILMPDHPGRAADLSRPIAAHRVTVVHVVPGLLDRFLDSVTDGGGRPAHPSLRRVVVDGAALPTGGVERFLTLLPGAELVIWYGHNETGVITVGSVGGRPVTNDRVYLLDERLRPVPPGSPGEMYIGGPPLACGYYNAPGQTAARFVATAGGGRLYRTGDIVRRRDGVLEYLGRVESVGGSLLSGSARGGHE
ncbi:AMP-binding protein [Nocardia sp. X0981]